MSHDFNFSSGVVDIDAHDLPGLKAGFVVRGVRDGSTVVDVGCGGGKMLRTLGGRHHGLTLLGCDVIEPTDIGGAFTFAELEGEAGLLPYEDASADVVLMIDVLEHVDRPEKVLSEMARILRPDGVLLAFIPIEGESVSWYSMYRKLLGRDLYVKTKDHVNSFSHDEVERLLSAHFVVTERRFLYHMFGQLMDATLCAALLLGPVRRAFWTHSPYHGESNDSHPPSLVGRIVASTFRAANAAAWAESRRLSRVRAFSGGLLVSAKVRFPG